MVLLIVGWICRKAERKSACMCAFGKGQLGRKDGRECGVNCIDDELDNDYSRKRDWRRKPGRSSERILRAVAEKFLLCAVCKSCRSYASQQICPENTSLEEEGSGVKTKLIHAKYIKSTQIIRCNDKN